MSVEAFHDGRVVLHGGDCLDVLAGLPEASVDAVVTDPPYELGFMGRHWDKSGIAFRSETWAAIGRVMKPGAHLVAFGAPRNFHRMVCAIEDAGFEVRDALMWMFGTGMPKSLDVSKAIDRAAGAKRVKVPVSGAPAYQRSIGNVRPWMMDVNHVVDGADAVTADAKRWQGWGTALKPAYEPICLARWPLSEKTVAANVLRHGTGALNINACRVEGETPSIDRRVAAAKSGRIGRQGDSRSHEQGRFRANADREAAVAAYLTPKPGEVLGRWPANVCHDGSEDVVGAFPVTGPSCGNIRNNSARGKSAAKGAERARVGFGVDDDGGSAARFFYSAKADADDRLGSRHPTVKPVDLMQWLVRMVCPPGGLILDPFAGTGTTGEAALREGMRVEMVEREAEHIADITRRMAHVFDGEVGRSVARAKALAKAGDDHGPLFASETAP